MDARRQRRVARRRAGRRFAGAGLPALVALPAAEENAPAQSLYLAPSQVPQEGPARVLLGNHGAARSAIPAPASMNYLAVRLKDGERWRYMPPTGHTVGWVAVNAGRLDAGGPVATGELAVFEESAKAIDFVAHGDTAFVLGSAAKHPHELVMGRYSVHTSKAALDQGEAEIRRIGAKGDWLRGTRGMFTKAIGCWLALAPTCSAAPRLFTRRG
jgi:redox-sensitive bicupin YhaK (pirin superfamily)